MGFSKQKYDIDKPAKGFLHNQDVFTTQTLNVLKMTGNWLKNLHVMNEFLCILETKIVTSENHKKNNVLLNLEIAFNCAPGS